MTARLTRGILADKMGVTPQAISNRVTRIKEKEYKNTISRDDALHILATRLGIDLTTYASPEKLDRVGELLIRVPPPPQMVIVRSEVPTRKRRVLKLDIGDIDIAFVPPKIIDDAKRMAQVYAILYAFENSVRFLIVRILESKYGPDWWDDHVNPKIREKAADRMTREKENAWHSQRRAHPIFYTDFSELKTIIRRNETDFGPLFAGVIEGLKWVEVKMAEIGMSRNVVAHHNPLKPYDIKRIRQSFGDWQRQLSSIADRLS